MNVYNHCEWVRFREEVIKLDGGKCVRCDRSRADGVVLQVHHKSYLPGRLPWEYGHTECETLCKGCHAQEHGVIMPQSDWTLIGSDDLGELGGNCEYCNTELRYVFAIIHPKWGAMAVGTVCCDRLTLTSDASEYHERYVKTREKRGRFLSSSRWKAIPSGWTIKQEGIVVRIWRDGESFRISMNAVDGKAKYPTLIDAKLRTFDLIESGEAMNFLSNRRRTRQEKWGARKPLDMRASLLKPISYYVKPPTRS